MSNRSEQKNTSFTFRCLEERKQRAAAAKWLALVSLVFCLCQFWGEYKLQYLIAELFKANKNDLPSGLLHWHSGAALIAAVALLTSGSLVIAQQDLLPQAAYVSDASISKGTAIAATAVGTISAFVVLFFKGRLLRIPIIKSYSMKPLLSNLFVAIMAIIFFGFAFAHDPLAWEGDKLVSKDKWEDCDSYNEGTCETMDQWNEKKC